MATRPVPYNTDTELSSVNAILAAIGQAPITTLNFDNPQVSLIHNLLMECSIDVQNEGWVFNRENHYPLKPDADDHIRIPANMLRIDISEGQIWRATDVVKRGGMLYDKMRHSNIFTEPVEVDVVWLFDYTDLPTVFQRYITYRAAGRACAQMVVDRELVQMITAQEAFTRAACMEYECNQGDYTIFGTPDGTAYRPYQPFQALFRR